MPEEEDTRTPARKMADDNGGIYTLTGDEAEYNAYAEELDTLEGYRVIAATHDEDGKAIPENKQVWVRGHVNTHQAIPDFEDVEDDEGKAVVQIPVAKASDNHIAALEKHPLEQIPKKETS